jgi:hypothetical protein
MISKMNTKDIILKIKNKLYNVNNQNIKYLTKEYVLEWLFYDSEFVTSLDKKTESEWGKKTIGYDTNQWTTKLGENILKDILTLLGQNPTRINIPIKGQNDKRLLPDFETKYALYENKARTYSTTGTAGEKILGTPMKYCECYRLYKKPLYIVCMAYQEKEANDTFQLFEPKSSELRMLLQYYEKELNIKYIKATDLLKKLIENESENQENEL